MLAHQSKRLPLFLRFIVFGLSFIALHVLVGGVVGVGFVGWLMLNGQLQSSVAGASLEEVFETHQLAITAVSTLPIAGGTFVLCYLCRVYLDHRPWHTMGFSPSRLSIRNSVLAGGLFGGVLLLIPALVVGMVGGYQFHAVRFSAVPILLFPVLALMAFTEELIVRGYLLQNLLDQSRRGFGILLSSTVFWLLHGLNPGVWSSPWISANLFVAGVILAYVYILFGSTAGMTSATGSPNGQPEQLSESQVGRVGNIWFATAAHLGWNASQGLLLDIPVSGLNFRGIIPVTQMDDFPDWLTGGRFGLEGSAVTLLLQVIVVLVLALKSRTASETSDCSSGP